MKFSLTPLYLILFLINLSCSQKAGDVSNIEKAPSVALGDKQYADVYKPLDGTWEGEFMIYQNNNLQSKEEVELRDITVEDFKNPALELINTIAVKQVYKSESPYFQKVTITDYYPDKDETVVSYGVNKIEKGKMWCVVKKPDETIIHEGKSSGNTITWSREENSPQRVEYFKETVLKNSYEILGWGYYDGDDLTLSPKLWFYAKYDRINN